MAIAVDILSDVFSKTKSLFFPIRPSYWLKMGFVSLFAGNGYGGSGTGSGPGGGGSDIDPLAGMTFREALAQFNSKALGFLSQYGYILGIGFFVFYAIMLFFTYLSSVFTFMFIEGLLDKEIKIRKSFSKNQALGASLFYVRVIVGLITLGAFLLFFSPLLYSFFNNTLSSFNFWLLIPMLLGLILFFIMVGIVMFLFEDFAVPLMYLKRRPFGQAWDEFRKIASGNKLEVFIYWLMKLVLGIAAGIASLVVLIPILLLAGLFAAIGIVLYLVLNAIGGLVITIIVLASLGILAVIFMVYVISVLVVPIPSFFRLYSVEMVKGLEKKKHSR